MATVVDHHAMNDAELIAASRDGDADAFAELYRRHEPAARAAARALCNKQSDVDDVVSEAFVNILRILQNGNGPEVAFRPYLVVAVRNRVHDRNRRISEDPLDEPTQQLDLTLLDSTLATEDRLLVGTAFATLPERWQLVLWHTEVEGRTPAEIAPLMGISPNAVAALAHRAREGLRQAYLQAHLQTPRDPNCASFVPLLAAYVRDTLSTRDRAAVEAHLHQCESCPVLLAELTETSTTMRAGLVGALLGVPASKYVVHMGKGMVGWFARLSGLQRTAALSAVAAAAVATGVFTASVVSPSTDRPTIAAAPLTTETRPVDTTGPASTRGNTTSTVPATQAATTTVAPTSTLVMPTLPPGQVSRVPNSTTTTPATTEPAAPAAAATSTPPSTSVAAPPHIMVATVQLGIALLGGQVRVAVSVTASGLPMEAATRAFSNLGVAVPMPAGVSLIATDNPAWTCSPTGACTIASLADGASSSATLTLSLAPDAALPLTLAPVVINPSDANVEALPLTLQTALLPGLVVHEFARGSLTAIGSSTCPLGACSLLGSSAHLEVTGTVSKAVLVWSGVSASSNRDTVTLATPTTDVDVTADPAHVVEYIGDFGQHQYVAYADVTAALAGNTTYTVSNLRTTVGSYGGWSLIVITHDPAQPLRSLMICTPVAYLDGSSPLVVASPAPIAPSSDAHVIVAAFEASPLALLDSLALNSLVLEDPFHGIDGVDLVDLTVPDVGAGTGELNVGSSGDSVMIAAIGLATDLV